MGVKSIVIKEINDSPFKVGDIVHISPAPKDDAECIAYNFGVKPEDVVKVDEYPLDPWGEEWYWSSNLFAPISDIDEKEMIREYNKVIIRSNI